MWFIDYGLGFQFIATEDAVAGLEAGIYEDVSVPLDQVEQKLGRPLDPRMRLRFVRRVEG